MFNNCFHNLWSNCRNPICLLWAVNRTLCRSYECVIKHKKCLCISLAVIILLAWLLWSYLWSLVHVVKLLVHSDYRECAYRRRNYELQEQSSPLYVTLHFHGRIGNWMYSYASLLGIARANGYIPYLTSSHPLTNIFSLTKVQPGDVECLRSVNDEVPCTYNQEFLNLPAGNISIDGYLQSWKYFRFIEQEIRDEFKLIASLKNIAELEFKNYVDEYLQAGRPVVGIHVRRGDMLRKDARKIGFRYAPKTYLDNAMKYMLQRYPRAVFFVASDDIEWCQANIISPALDDALGPEDNTTTSMLEGRRQDRAPVVFSRSQSSRSDFAMLTFCNHSIMTVGTFGWWSAWLAGGHVVYYKDFSVPGSLLDISTKREDFFLPHWVALSASSLAVHGSIFVLTLCINLVLSVCMGLVL